MIEACSRPLSRGRTCVHVKGAPAIGYKNCGEQDCAHGHALPAPHRHSHTWQQGDARYCQVNDYRVDMETGEISGEWPEIDMTGLRASDDHIRVLELHFPGFAEAMERTRKEAEMLNAPNGYRWYYTSPTHIYGDDPSGHAVEFERVTGKITRLYSVNQRHEAVDYAQRFGAAKASRKLDIPQRTVRSWAERG